MAANPARAAFDGRGAAHRADDRCSGSATGRPAACRVAAASRSRSGGFGPGRSAQPARAAARAPAPGGERARRAQRAPARAPRARATRHRPPGAPPGESARRLHDRSRAWRHRLRCGRRGSSGGNGPGLAAVLDTEALEGMPLGEALIADETLDCGVGLGRDASPAPARAAASLGLVSHGRALRHPFGRRDRARQRPSRRSGAPCSGASRLIPPSGGRRRGRPPRRTAIVPACRVSGRAGRPRRSRSRGGAAAASPSP